MQNLRYYIRKELIGAIINEKVEEKYSPVNFQIRDMIIRDLMLTVSTHRLLFTCESSNCLMVDMSCMTSVDIREQGVFKKKKWIEVRTVFGDSIVLTTNSLNEAFIQIRGALNKGVWKTIVAEQPTEIKPAMYAGMHDHQKKINNEISEKEQKVTSSFSDFDKLFENARQLKEVIGYLKESLKVRDEAFQSKGQVDDILNNMGFVSTITKEEAGKDYYNQEAHNIYKICQEYLFKQFGGMISMLDLYYYYNKKRQTCLISPEELLKACRKMEGLGLKARIVDYPNNVRMLESTVYDSRADFEKNYMPFFINGRGTQVAEISRKRNIPAAIVQIKIDQAVREGRLAKDDRLEGVRYFENLILMMNP